MTNPEAYFRDAEQLESEMSDCGHSGTRQRAEHSYGIQSTARDCRYSRETLRSGCILYSLRMERNDTQKRNCTTCIGPAL